MRLKAAFLMCFLLLLSGCSSSSSGMEQAQTLRTKLQNGSGCSFRANVTADYGEALYEFSLDCQTDNEGNFRFTVVTPESICGISGIVDTHGARLTFDDKALAFSPIADGQITPVMAPWILIKTLYGGYLSGCAVNNDGFLLAIDDSYREDALRLNIQIDNQLSLKWAEIFWQNRRVLTVTVENFTFL